MKILPTHGFVFATNIAMYRDLVNLLPGMLFSGAYCCTSVPGTMMLTCRPTTLGEDLWSYRNYRRELIHESGGI